MTILKNNGKHWEWTLLVDTFNNEIIAHSVSPIAGDNEPYYHCLDKLNNLAGKKEEQRSQVVSIPTWEPSTSQGLFSTLMIIISYFGQCREGELQQIIQ